MSKNTMTYRRLNHAYRIVRQCAGMLVACLAMVTAYLVLVITPSAQAAVPQLAAAAAVAPACVASPSPATLSLGSVTVPAGTANGVVLGSPTSVSVTFSCTGTNFFDTFNILTGNLAALDSSNTSPGGGILFASSLPGIDIQLTATPTQAGSGNNGPNGTRGWNMGQVNCFIFFCNTVTTNFTAQLVKVGPVAPGTTSTINLLQFFDTNSNFTGPSPAFGTLVLNPVTVTAGSCTVFPSSKNFSVLLPTVSASALNGTGQLAGTTPFNVQYTCNPGNSLYITLNTNTPGTATGVILPPASCTTGTPAANVGVRLLQGNYQAVNFGIAQSLGPSPNGTLTVPYYAQYYATGSPVGAGPVCATATFTMSYN
ncbi:Pilin (type 1 fimbria component protein) [Rhodanobacter glycinis]|uniref:Pilin (Type 1 fimbria component protein) n=1 Tax=Rhodanobacter glycinis TaxID=582702 RepID=A0A1I3Z152_9GAMM|nr:Pilin (type 1 fimbria component protein) [Rhodanobacter glycinis]